MTGGLIVFTRMRAFVLLLLAVIGLQASVPIRAPLDRMPGSAFSATTLDVSLASSWRTEAKARLTVPMPATLPELQRARQDVVVPAAAIVFAGSRPKARGPPPRSHPSRPPDSTAPPLA